MANNLKVHEFLPYSEANGPGVRAVLWVQGCSLGCFGCFNPETHSRSSAEGIPVDTLFQRICALEGTIEGLSVSGGEPLQQMKPLTALLKRIKTETTLSVLVFSGYRLPEILKMKDAQPLLEWIDVLIAGRYEAPLRLAQDLRGSSNKQVHFLSDRYGPQDLEGIPEGEIFIGPAGAIALSGIDPLKI
jgi:anaerobic ribonucleoside-triphosphate reductase activating protein